MRLFAALAMVAFVMSGCSQSEPVTLGFIGTLTGRTADLGGHARNGMILAVEHQNAAGGLFGKPVQMIIKDDRHEETLLKQGLQSLIDSKVNAIIGPTTSTMGLIAAPIATDAKTVLFGVTASTETLSNQDDYFFRAVTADKRSQSLLLDYLNTNYDFDSFAIVTDVSNEAFASPWANDFKARLENAGLVNTFEESFRSGNNLNLLSVAQRLALVEADLLVLVSNARETALLVKQIRSINNDIVIATSAWAGTQTFLQLAGNSAEGVIVPRYIDDQSEEARFLELKSQYLKRFQIDMGYAALLSYNSTQALLNAIEQTESKNDLKQTLLKLRTFDGALATFELNEFGDEVRDAFQFISVVENGQYTTVKD